MKALNAWLGPEKRGAGTWQSGTHGNESGIYGRSDQLDPNFLGRDIAEGRYSNLDAQPFTNPLPEVFGPGEKWRSAGVLAPQASQGADNEGLWQHN